MLEVAEQEIRNIRQLLSAATSENVELVAEKLEYLTWFLQFSIEAIRAGQTCEPKMRDFLTRLPEEMNRIHILLRAPQEYFQTLSTMRMIKFGSYERTGSLCSTYTPQSCTTMHL